MLQENISRDYATASEATAHLTDYPQGIEIPKAPCEQSEPFSRGTWFEEGLTLSGSSADQLVDRLVSDIEGSEKRLRKRRERDQSNLKRLIRAIAANALRCAEYRSLSIVSYSRRAGAYSLSPDWLTGKAIARTVDLMERTGLLKTAIGIRGTCSNFEATNHFLDECRNIGVEPSDLTMKLDEKSLIRLRGGSSQGEMLHFPPTDYTEASRSHLTRYNRFVGDQRLSLVLTDQEQKDMVAALNENRTIKLLKPELIATGLYRVFNDGTFDHGGRLYGGWWQNIPSRYRPRIRINGQPTVEPDFQAQAIHFLYHERRLEFEGDPYSLETIETYERQKGLPPQTCRNAIKKLTQSMINCENLSQLKYIPLDHSFYPDFTRAELCAMIEKKHDAIADAFLSGSGKRIQREDSDIAMAILQTAMDNDIVVLPIHDSFICKEKDREMVVSIMKQSYLNRLGFIPTIK